MADLPVDPDRAPISHIPGEDDVLSRFVATGVRSWGGEQVLLPIGITVMFWGVGVADAVLAVWLSTVRTGLLRPSGWWFDVATLGGFSGGLLVVAAANAVLVAVLAIPTRGLSRASAAPLAMLAAGGIGGAIALLGVAALLLITAVVVGVLLGVLAFAASRI